MAERVGQQLGNYRLTQLIGSGGFAEVYLGEHIYLSTFAAIKIISTQLIGTERQLFLREARIVASLSHPNIIQVLDYGVDNQVPFLVMPYMPNGTLRQRYPKGVALPLRDVVAYVKQVAFALQFAHDRKLIHGDVKPENLLLGNRHQILLSDFGTASIMHTTQLQKSGQLIGTVAYMAPEQIRGKPCFASDQYSLAVIAYEWLAGKRPFEGSFSEIASQHLMASPSSLLEKNSLLTPEVEGVIMRGLAKEPEDRFKKISAFANALEQASGISTPSLVTTPTLLSSDGEDLPTVNRESDKTIVAIPLIPISQHESVSAPDVAVDASSGQATSSQEAIVTSEPVPSPPARSSPPRLSRRVVVGGAISLAALALASGSAVIFFSSRLPAVTYRGHSLPVYTLAWSPDGDYIVSGGADNTAQIWEAATGKQVLSYRRHAASINALAWGPVNGTRIALGSADQLAEIWHASTGSTFITYDGHTSLLRSIAWSLDEKLIASAGDDTTVHIWDADTGQTRYIYRGHSKLVWSAQWSPDGRYIASGGVDSTVHVWEALTGKLRFRYTDHTRAVKFVAWSPDGTHIATCSDDTTVQIWEATTGRRVMTYTGHRGNVNTLAWSHNGKLIVSGSDDATAQIWEAATGRLVRKFEDQAGEVVHAVRWAPNGSTLAIARHDHIVQVWNNL